MGIFFGRYVILLQRYNGEWRAFMAVERDGHISTCDISSFDAIEKFATRQAAERCVYEKIRPVIAENDFENYAVIDKNDIRQYRRD